MSRLLHSEVVENVEVAIGFIRQIARNNRTVLLEDLFNDKEGDAYDIVRRQDELDQWHKLKVLQE